MVRLAGSGAVAGDGRRTHLTTSLRTGGPARLVSFASGQDVASPAPHLLPASDQIKSESLGA